MRPAIQLSALAVVMQLTISSNLLEVAGIPYQADGGPLISKFHPASIVILLAWILRWRCRLDGKLLCFLASILFCIAYAAITTGRGYLIVFLDTFVPAGLLALVLQDATHAERQTLLALLQLCIVGNASLALFEAAAQCNFVPIYLEDHAYLAVGQDFRPTALYDHPLTGATLTMLALLLPGIGEARGRRRISYDVVLVAGLVAFGGRTAIILTALAAIGRTARQAMLSLMHRALPKIRLQIVWPLLTLPGFLFIAPDFGARLFSHLYWDDSASVRLRQWHVLEFLRPDQWLLGISRLDLIALLAPLQLAYGVGVIENFWLIIFVVLGFAGFAVFLVGFVSLLTWCAREAGQGGILMVLSVVAAASSSNSLGRKSGLLVVLVAAACASRSRMSVEAVPHETGAVLQI